MPIIILLIARPTTRGEDSALKIAHVPTISCIAVKQIEPKADYSK